MTTTQPSREQFFAGRGLLAAVAVLLAANLGVQLITLGGGSTALAQNRSGSSNSDVPTGFPNAAAAQQRNAEALTDIAQRLSRIEARLDKGLSVKVTEMPAIVFPSNTGGQNNANAGK